MASILPLYQSPFPPGDQGDGSTGSSTPTPTDVSGKTYAFIASWLVLILLLTLISRTRVGYVIVYYSLLLMILVVLVTEYKQIAPLLTPMTIGELDAQT
jgi:hypothetical protein